MGQALHVTVVSDNPETLDGLESYFSSAGVGVHTTRRMGSTDIPPISSAVVFFPDDFLASDVLEAVARLRRARPAVLPILVTRDPRRFDAIADVRGKGPAPIVLPKPAWGWTLLDAIRGHRDAPH